MGNRVFDDLKRAIGFGGPTEEVWRCDPLVVVVDATDELLWRDPAIVRYAPGEGRYEGGVGAAETATGQETIIEFKLRSIVHRDAHGIEFPFGAMVPWGESGVTVTAEDPDGRAITLHTNIHAVSYLQNRAAGNDPVELPPGS